jgi:predicted RNA-binding protein YlxR (DUF448 family)
MSTNTTVETSSLTSAEGIPSVEGASLRRCIVTAEVLPKSQMVRFVIAPDGVVTPDVKSNLPGRGLWLTARRDMVDKACAKELFYKVGRRRVTLSDDLSDRVEALLAHRCLCLLGISRRAGLAVAGHDKVRAALTSRAKGREKDLWVLFAASDGSESSCERLHAMIPQAPYVEFFTGAELGAIFGRDRAVHVLAGPGGLTKNLAVETSRLGGFRAPYPSEDKA